MENLIQHKSSLTKTDLFILTSPNFQRSKKSLKERVKAIISDPVFEKPISDLNRDLSQKGSITLVTRIKNY